MKNEIFIWRHLLKQNLIKVKTGDGINGFSYQPLFLIFVFSPLSMGRWDHVSFCGKASPSLITLT